jgi:SAM-dependent methyltransferase
MLRLDPNPGTSNSDPSSLGAAPATARGYRYDRAFYRYIEAGSLRSAATVVPLVLRELLPASVLDVGCGAGAWLAEYRNQGLTDFLGVDGAYVQPNSLLISADHFQSHDVTLPFALGRRFDIVQCLEVGEHLPEAASDTLVENLTRHGDKVLFSAASPGQGGENHVNEQTCEFWRLLFARHGYLPFDWIRPIIKGVTTVESWYRYNMVLYVAQGAISELPHGVSRSGIGEGQAIPTIAPLGYRIRTRAISMLPMWCVTKIALTKHVIVMACRSLRKG